MYGPNGCGKTRIVEDVCRKLSMHLFKVFKFLEF
jgi:MoxR-like ATPase